MEGSPGDFFEASKDVKRKYINQLLALVRRYSERPESSNEERLRWSKARYVAAIVARTTGNMDTATFEAESHYHAAWFAWAVRGVLCPPESQLVRMPDFKEPVPQKQDTKPSGETKPTPERVREIQEYNRQRLLDPPIGEADTKKKLH